MVTMWQKNKEESARGFFGFELPPTIVGPLGIGRAAGESHSGCWTTLQKCPHRCQGEELSLTPGTVQTRPGLGILWLLLLLWHQQNHCFGAGD